jgi:hypothetical protein
MTHRIAWKYLQTLTPPERAQFLRWLEAELGPRQAYLQQLAQLLVAATPPIPTETHFWARLYPDQPYDDGRLRKLLRDLSQQLETYLSIQAFRRDEGALDQFLLRELNRREAPDLFRKALRRIETRLQRLPGHTPDYYRQRYELEVERQHLEVRLGHPAVSSSPASSTDPFAGLSTPKRAALAFDGWWTLEKLHLALVDLNLQHIYGHSPPAFLVTPLLEQLPQLPLYAKDPWFSILHEAYQTLSGEFPKAFDRLMGDLKQHQLSLPDSELRFLHSLLLNHSVRGLNRQGSREMARRIYELYEWAIEAGFILLEGQLPRQHYKNLITISLRIEDFQRAWHYLHMYQPLLPEEVREDAFMFNLANYHYACAEYGKVVQLVSGRRFQRTFEEIHARANMLQAQYELEQDREWLVTQLESLIRYVRDRRDLSDLHKKSYLNRLRLFRRLLQANGFEELARLASDIETTEPIDHPDWLRQKVAATLAQSRI